MGGGAVVGDACDDNDGRGPPYHPAPWAHTVQFQRTARLSGTLRMLSDPTTNQTTKMPNTTGNPPGRPRIGCPRLNRSSSGPPKATAMMPAPAGAVFEKAQEGPPSRAGGTARVKAQSTGKKTPK